MAKLSPQLRFAVLLKKKIELSLFLKKFWPQFVSIDTARLICDVKKKKPSPKPIINMIITVTEGNDLDKVMEKKVQWISRRIK